MDPATWICAILADLFASAKEREADRQRLQNQIDDLRSEIEALKSERDVDH
jgi:hypothetical protein